MNNTEGKNINIGNYSINYVHKLDYLYCVYRQISTPDQEGLFIDTKWNKQKPLSLKFKTVLSHMTYAF